jgi:hypothetical protein
MKLFTNTLICSFLAFLVTESYAQHYLNSTVELNIVHDANDANFPSAPFGTGASFFDFDNDGWDDITLVRFVDEVQFYRNVGGTFQLMPSFASASGATAQGIWVDYDNDGDNDFFQSTYNSGACRLYRNDGNWVFTDVTIEAGLIGLTSRNYGVSFADYDKDGDLDFYLCRYQIFGSVSDPLATNALYRNNGDGTFTNVTALAGVTNGLNPSFMGAWMDYNNDGWPDLVVINDKPSFNSALYKNLGNGTFEDVSAATNMLMSQQDPMSTTFADFDHDGDLDLYVTNTGFPESQARLFVNQNGSFVDEAPQRGVNLDKWSWGATFLDFDNNTYLDLFAGTGYTYGHWEADVQSVFYINDSTNHFVQAPPSFLENTPNAATYGVAIGDIQNNGYPDLMLSNGRGSQSMILKNTGGSNNFIKVSLEGTISNRMAIGSWIKLYIGDHVYSHYTRCGENYCSQNSQHHIFGLGQVAQVDSIIVTYLSGIQDKYYEVAANQHYYFTEGETLVFAIENSGFTSICPGAEINLSAPDFDLFSWNTGDSTQTITVSEPGSYYLSAWNSAGHQYLSDTLEIVALDPIAVNSMVSHISCFGLGDGTITLDIQTQATSYLITWSNGAEGNQISSLGAGTYTYSYLDNYGCQATNDILIFEPEEMSLFTQISPEDNNSLGTLQLFAVGGVAPYQYLINGNVATALSTLESGTYDVQVIDATGCSFSTSVFIPFDEGLGMAQMAMSSTVLYPNPLGFPFALTIQSDSWHDALKVHVFDAQGRNVFTKTEMPIDDKLKLNLPYLSNGSYTLVIQAMGRSEFHQLQIQD